LSDLAQHSVQPTRRGLALPLFGTTLTHAAALYAAWGPQPSRAYFADLKARGVRFLEGNASVRDAVVRGEMAFGLTDSDDAEGALARGAEVAVAEINSGMEDGGTLVIPSSVALVKGGPHTREGRALVDFLASAEVESLLAENGFWQVAPRHPGASRSLPRATTKSMKVDWNRVLDELPRASRELREIFTR
jgi:iron(III) transport system substrate-binding protein